VFNRPWSNYGYGYGTYQPYGYYGYGVYRPWRLFGYYR